MRKLFYLIVPALSICLCSCHEHKKNVEVTSLPLQTFEKSQEPSEIISQAKKVAAYFYLDSSDINYYDEAVFIEIDGRKWCRVTDVRFNSPDNAKEFLQTQFSNEVANKIFRYAIDNEIFKEINGNFYALMPCDSGKFVNNAAYSVKSCTANKIIYDVAIDYYKEGSSQDEQIESKHYTFVREKIDNRWVFTEFEYVW